MLSLQNDVPCNGFEIQRRDCFYTHSLADSTKKHRVAVTVFSLSIPQALGGFCRKSQSYINIKLSVTVKLSRYYYAERMFVCQVLLPQIVEKVNTVNTEFAKKILKSAFQYGKLYKDYCMPKHLRGQQRLILGE